MIEVKYDGNLGNNLFQYCFGRILAESLGYELSADPLPGFPRTRDHVDGHNYCGRKKIVLRGQRPDLSFVKNENPVFHVLLTGYFQRSEYYLGHLDKIREWLKSDYPPINDEIKPDDVVMGIRRGRDYIPYHGLPISYYENALKHFNYNRVHITTNEPDDPFVAYLARKYDARVRPPGALDNLEFIKKFKKIIISNSTFLWWAAVLSDADRIIFPRPSNGFWSRNDYLSKNINLEIHDSRYLYLDCEPYKSTFMSEIIQNTVDNVTKSLKKGLKNVFPFLGRGYTRDPDAPVFSEDYD